MLLNLLVVCARAQSLIIKGRVKCYNSGEQSTKGAENVVVVPGFSPPRSTTTASFPSGYFEINTGLPYSKLRDKTISLYALSGCATCTESAKRIFVSEDQDRRNKQDGKHYVTIKEWMLKTNCRQAEVAPAKADSMLQVVTAQPSTDIEHMTAVNALAGTPALLNLISSLTTVAAAGGVPNEKYALVWLEKRQMRFGDFLMASPFSQSAVMGFNFSPVRDMSDAVFRNPSAMAFHPKAGHVSIQTNAKNHGRISGFYAINEKLRLGAGLMVTQQDEFLSTRFQSPLFERSTDTMLLKLREMAVQVSAAYQINTELSVGGSLKMMRQSFNIPDSLHCDGQGFGTFIDTQINHMQVDADISATYKPHPAWQFGINAMNLGGSSLYADAFIPSQLMLQRMTMQRSVGAGVVYKYRRLHAGTDLLFAKGGLYDISFGLNYVPFNHALLSAGYAIKQQSYALSFRMKHARIAYISDNGQLVNEQRNNTRTWLNGRIYGGLMFDLN
jgi:hypothetical protein